MSLQDLIAPVSHKLTPTERRIAARLDEDATLLAFGNVSDIAQHAGTSRPSIVRFATKLGFQGFTDLQNWARDDLAQRLTSPTQRIRRPDPEGTHLRTSLEQAVRHTLDTLDDVRLDAIAAPLAKADSVWIVSGETSMAGAVVLHTGLSMIRGRVNLVQEQSAARQLASAQPTDAAVVFDFVRYRRSAILAARALAELGTTLIAITDGPLSPLAALTNNWTKLHIPAVGPFDSAIPAVLTAELITARVVKHLGRTAHTRIDRLEQLWQDMGTFLEYVPRDSKKG